MNSKNSKGKYRIGNVHLTATVSMSLVLFLIGLVLLLIFAARDVSTHIRENISLSLILKDNITADNTSRIERYLQSSKFVKSFDYISKEDALKEHIRTMGEDPEKFLGYNPLMASFEIKLNADYANKDSVEVFESKLKMYEDIDRVAYQKDMVTLVNDNITRISFILLVIATILMLISITLLNNTIRGIRLFQPVFDQYDEIGGCNALVYPQTLRHSRHNQRIVSLLDCYCHAWRPVAVHQK